MKSSIKVIMFIFSVLDQKKSNLIREGGKKTFKKKTLKLFLDKVMRATK